MMKDIICNNQTYFSELTLSATKRTITNASMKQPAAILVVRRFVDASMKTIPQNEEPRSAIQSKAAASPKGPKVD